MNGIVPIVIGGGSLLLNIVGLSIPYWLYMKATFDSTSTSFHVGLWQACAIGVCGTFPESGVPGSLKATRAMEILGMMLLMGALACAVLKFVKKDQAILHKVAGGCAVVAGILMIIGCVIFAAKFKTSYSGYDLHAGFALCIVAAIGSIVAAVLFFMVRD